MQTFNNLTSSLTDYDIFARNGSVVSYIHVQCTLTQCAKSSQSRQIILYICKHFSGKTYQLFCVDFTDNKYYVHLRNFMLTILGLEQKM